MATCWASWARYRLSSRAADRPRRCRSPGLCYWPQDVPFGVINVLFVMRLASLGDQTNRGYFTIQLLILLTSVATLVYKAMHLKDFPAVWREHELLLVEKRELDERFRVLSNASAKPNANSAAAQSSEITEDTASESGADDAETAAAAAAEAVEDGAVAAAVAKPATAVPLQPSQLNLRSGIGDNPAQPGRAVLEVMTFEIGMLPECGR